MALQTSGQISMNDINVELGNSGTAQISLNDAAVRTLLQKASGQISLADAYGKSNAWTPDAIISSVKIWYDADDAATITLNGSNVSQWSDKSGSNWHASNATSSTQPVYATNAINGKPTLTFFYDQLTASSAYLTGTGYQGFIITYMDSTSTAYARATSFNKSGNYNDFSNTFSWLPTFRNNGAVVNTMQNTFNPSNASISYGQPFLHTSVLPTGTGLYHRLNGGTIPGTGVTSTSLDTTLGLRLGNANNVNPEWYHGGISEVVFTSGLSQADIENVEGYLAWKWGLALAPGHPYALDGTKFGYGQRWTPAQMSTTMWLDASDASTITIVGSSQVGQWSDKSGNGKHAVQPASAQAPYYVPSATYLGASVIEFRNYNGMHMNVPNLVLTNKNHQIFIVADMDSTSENWARLISLRQSGQSQDFSNTTSWVGLARNSNTSNFISGHNYINTNVVAGSIAVPIVLCATFGSSLLTLRGGGSQSSGGVTTNNLNTTDGAKIAQSLNTFSELFRGRIAEIIVCPEQSLANTEKIEGYLAHKWGAAGSLVSTHPYKNSPP
jgi:hypothetical protein